MPEPMKTGVIGCGNISPAYFKASQLFKRYFEIVACADLNPEAAKARAEEYGIRSLSVQELLESNEIEAVLNLTTPQAHSSINLAALDNGKHVYCEKPFALALADGSQVLEKAKRKSLRTGCAPDTFLGGAHQTARKLLDDGWLGTPLNGTAIMQCAGHESWHPAPEFYYKKGGGPLFDMGPYYITALINLLGPVSKVVCMAARGTEFRTATSAARLGDKFPTEVNTHYSGILQFACGTIITLIMSFDVPKHSCPCLQLHGTKASLDMADPNCFDGTVKLFKRDSQEWQTCPNIFEYNENVRSIGLADMASAIRSGRKHRCTGAMANHVLEIMTALEKASEQGSVISIESCCERPQSFPSGLLKGELD